MHRLYRHKQRSGRIPQKKTTFPKYRPIITQKQNRVNSAINRNVIDVCGELFDTLMQIKTKQAHHRSKERQRAF
jgi:hypothetical protein